MSRTSARRATAALVAAASVAIMVAGCSSGTDKTNVSASSSAASSINPASGVPFASDNPADGPEVKGTDFAVHLPKGWEDWTTQANQPGALPSLPKPDGFPPGYTLYAVDRTAAATNGRSQTLTMYYDTPAPEDDTVDKSLADIEAHLPAYLEQQGGTNVTAHPRVSVDGAPAVHFSATNSTGYDIHQIWAVRGNKAAVIQFALTGSGPQADRDKLIASVLSTWKWRA